MPGDENYDPDDEAAFYGDLDLWVGWPEPADPFGVRSAEGDDPHFYHHRVKPHEDKLRRAKALRAQQRDADSFRTLLTRAGILAAACSGALEAGGLISSAFPPASVLRIGHTEDRTHRG